jgi:predicted alpha/beta-fold hydrolase
MSLVRDIATGTFEPPLGLGHPHLQSMLSGWPLRGRWLRSRAAALLGASSEILLDCGDGVTLQGWVSRQPNPRGLAVILHGWEGCAEANYVVSGGARLFAHGYDVFRLNFRDHGGTWALNPDLFHSCRIEEVVNAVVAIQQKFPAERTVLVGHSLGGNFALRIAARAEEAGLDLERVFAVCPVLDPHATMTALEQVLWIYRHNYLRRWSRSLEK